jgi:hypothetical protein
MNGGCQGRAELYNRAVAATLLATEMATTSSQEKRQTMTNAKQRPEVIEATDEQFREEMRRAVAAFVAAKPPKIAGVHHVYGRYSMADTSLRIGREGGRQEAQMFLAEMRDDRGFVCESLFPTTDTHKVAKS